MIAQPHLTALVAATDSGRVVRVKYIGTGREGWRTVHPHVIYQAPGGGLFLEGIQVSGPASAELPGWMTFTLAKVVAVQDVDLRFTPSASFDPDAERYARTFACCLK